MSLFIVGNVAYSFLAREIAATHRLSIDGHILDNQEKVADYLAKELYSKVDGKPLATARSVPAKCRWLGYPTKFLF